MTSVVVPAHNEESGLARLLSGLTAESAGPPLEIVVVANGCTDATADVARDFPGVQVVETPVPSKIRALALGDEHVSSYPRLYVDADVQVDRRGVDALVSALGADGVHAAGPTRVLPMDGVAWAVRRYYDVWQRLEGVRSELYGRGVIAVDEEGHRRLADWPEVMADDLLVAMSFTATERVVVADAEVIIRPPRTYRDLLRRRTRAMTGNRALRTGPAAVTVRSSGSTMAQLVAMVRRQPRLAPGAVVFLATAVLAKARGRRAARRGDTTWLRDESSRST